MTAVETQNSDGMLRPTDLSLKGGLNMKYKEINQSSPASQQAAYEKTFPYMTDLHHQWRTTQVSEPKSIPFSLAFAGSDTRLATSIPLDSMAKLVVLESLFSQHKNYSSPAVFDHSTIVSSGPRSRTGSENSNEKFPINQPMIDAAKGLTELKQGGTYNNRAVVALPTNTDAVPNPVTSNKTKPCKRKGGWKFHDFSDESDGPGKRKRLYCHNRLENEIIQMYQDRVTIREVSPANSSSRPSDRLVVVEPTCINNHDLINFNTSLRIILDKKKGVYRLQVLPHTIEQGPLSNKQKVFSAVSRMLGENGSVLCPGISQARVPMMESDNYCSNGEQDRKQILKKNWLGFAPAQSESLSETELSNETKYRGRWKILHNYTANSKRSLTPPDNSSGSTVSPTDKLLMTLNKELSETQRHNSQALNIRKELNNANECLIWHVPPPSVKGKKSWPEEAKWCQNCLKKMRSSSSGLGYPRTPST